MREKKIGILALQETHLRSEHLDNLHDMFRRRLHIMYSSHPDNVNSQGVAIVLNKEMLHTDKAVSVPIIPGRALLTSIPWHQTRVLHVLNNIYALNTTGENEQF